MRTQTARQQGARPAALAPPNRQFHIFFTFGCQIHNLGRVVHAPELQQAAIYSFICILSVSRLQRAIGGRWRWTPSAMSLGLLSASLRRARR